MITVLAAGRGAGHLGESRDGSGSPSVEVMTAEEDEEVLDKLARNRRIDAVLLMPGEGAAALAAAIREEDPAGPPVYGWGEAARIEGVRGLAAQDAAAAIEELVADAVRVAARLPSAVRVAPRRGALTRLVIPTERSDEEPLSSPVFDSLPTKGVPRSARDDRWTALEKQNGRPRGRPSYTAPVKGLRLLLTPPANNSAERRNPPGEKDRVELDAVTYRRAGRLSRRTGVISDELADRTVGRAHPAPPRPAGAFR